MYERENVVVHNCTICHNKENYVVKKSYYKIMAQPYVTKEDLANAGISSKRKISKAYKYAHKLRLAGIEKSEALQKTLDYINRPTVHNNKSKKKKRK